MVYVNRLDSVENILPYDYDRLVFLDFLIFPSLLNALISLCLVAHTCYHVYCQIEVILQIQESYFVFKVVLKKA